MNLSAAESSGHISAKYRRSVQVAREKAAAVSLKYFGNKSF